MPWSIWFWTFVFITPACSQQMVRSQNRTTPTPTGNERLAQAQMLAFPGKSVQGSMSFEQMPNSMIVSYHLEGLKPKQFYQISVFQTNECVIRRSQSPIFLYQLKANKTGVSENTFKTEEFSVSGERGLMGQSVVVTATDPSSRKSSDVFVACGRVEPQSSLSPTESSADSPASALD